MRYTGLEGKGSEMGSTQVRSSPPGREAVRGWLTRSRQFAAGAPLPVQILVVAVVCVFAPALIAIGLFAALAYAPYALWTGDRSKTASAAVALWGIAVTAAFAHGAPEPRYLLLAEPVVVRPGCRLAHRACRPRLAAGQGPAGKPGNESQVGYGRHARGPIRDGVRRTGRARRRRRRGSGRPAQRQIA